MNLKFVNDDYIIYKCIFDNNVTLKIPNYKNYSD